MCNKSEHYDTHQDHRTITFDSVIPTERFARQQAFKDVRAIERRDRYHIENRKYDIDLHGEDKHANQNSRNRGGIIKCHSAEVEKTDDDAEDECTQHIRARSG